MHDPYEHSLASRRSPSENKDTQNCNLFILGCIKEDGELKVGKRRLRDLTV